MGADLIFTGFEPFGAFPVNPSWGVARHAAAAAMPGAEAELLPVTFRIAVDYGARVLDVPHPPRMLVHVGLAGTRDRICLERVGRNAGDGKPDNEGVVEKGPLETGGPDVVTTTVDVERLASELARETRIATVVSESAGGYVCNAIYYRSLRRASTTRVLFVHVPPLDDDGQRVVGDALGRLVREMA